MKMKRAGFGYMVLNEDVERVKRVVSKNAEYQAKSREKRKAKGIINVTVCVPEKHRQYITDLAKELCANQ